MNKVYQEERIYKILEILKAKKTMTNQEIMDQFHISRDTARRDIVRLVMKIWQLEHMVVLH